LLTHPLLLGRLDVEHEHCLFDQPGDVGDLFG
jgi:hypothetical protein